MWPLPLPSRPVRDAVFAVFICVAGVVLSLTYRLDAEFHLFIEELEGAVYLHQLPAAFVFAAIGFAWFAWRRWHDSERAAEESADANRLLSEQLSRNTEMIEELSEARRAAVEHDLAKTRFLAHMSHELRTPLNAIIGFSELMQIEVYGDVGDEHYREYIDNIHTSGHHLLELINDLLDMTRIESGDLTPQESAVGLGELADKAIVMLKDQAAVAGVRLWRAQSSVAWRSVRADRRMLKQVLINLIANAIRHTPAEGSIEISLIETEEGRVGFRISDTGEGMDAAAVRRAERGYAEVQNAYRREHNGAGIGLPLSRAIIQAHDGEMEISSAVGQGTCIDVLLPATRIIHSTAEQAADVA